ncbi:MAG: hypothetical protein IPL99_26150 [Candidatus Competibacteraceae bacterium]|nr:hypothetical protein [Candidatus Competibacteraceae bacterium]
MEWLISGAWMGRIRCAKEWDEQGAAGLSENFTLRLDFFWQKSYNIS